MHAEAAVVSTSLLVTMRILITCLLLLVTTVATCHGQDQDHGETYQIYPLRLKSGSGGQYIAGLSCKSWRLAVEAHNMIDWSTVPEECEDYMGNYMLGGQYRKDFELVAYEAFVYALSRNLSGDGKDVWVFDIDDTVISHLPYFSQHGFGYVLLVL